ncbi:MAG: SIMPL domain-containing protein [Rhodobacteraceae bacterium]|nr:SIMPL domain-containing protein [Paracoccaceae bacterium]
MRIFVIFLVLFQFLAAPGFSESGELVVVGQGRVTATPDMATVTLGVSVFGRTAAQALGENSRDMTAVLKLLAAAGIEDRDMQTAQLSLHPRWNNRSSSNKPPEVIGFEAVNTVVVRVRNLPALGEILDQIAQAGANQIQSIGFGLQNPRPIQDAARVDAIKDAQAKAKLYAEAAGVRLGTIKLISETGTTPPRPQFARMEAAMASDAVPIARGESEVSAQITLVFALE